MRTVHKLRRLLVGAALAGAAALSNSQATSNTGAVHLAQQQITAYLDQLADLHCNETVTQQKLSLEGNRVLATEKADFDYLIMMNGNADDFQLNESRVEPANARHRLVSNSMLVTNGMATVLLVFHPYYRDSFEFETREAEMINGSPAIPIHFTHISGRRTPAALALRGREFPLELEGTAWLDESSGQVVRVETGLQSDLSEIGLSSLKMRVEYKPVKLPDHSKPMYLPAMAVVDVSTPRQRWRNTHVFSGYRGFSTDTEQDPNVKILPDKKANVEPPPVSPSQGDRTTP